MSLLQILHFIEVVVYIKHPFTVCKSTYRSLSLSPAPHQHIQGTNFPLVARNGTFIYYFQKHTQRANFVSVNFSISLPPSLEPLPPHPSREPISLDPSLPPNPSPSIQGSNFPPSLLPSPSIQGANFPLVVRNETFIHYSQKRTQRTNFLIVKHLSLSLSLSVNLHTLSLTHTCTHLHNFVGVWFP